jgi:hypothetical protein
VFSWKIVGLPNKVVRSKACDVTMRCRVTSHYLVHQEAAKVLKILKAPYFASEVVLKLRFVVSLPLNARCMTMDCHFCCIDIYKLPSHGPEILKHRPWQSWAFRRRDVRRASCGRLIGG